MSKKFEDCSHSWVTGRITYDEAEENCIYCHATRKGSIVWGDWNLRREKNND